MWFDSRKRVSSYVYIWFDNMKIDYFSLSFDHCSSIANNSLSIVNVTPQLWIVNWKLNMSIVFYLPLTIIFIMKWIYPCPKEIIRLKLIWYCLMTAHYTHFFYSYFLCLSLVFILLLSSLVRKRVSLSNPVKCAVKLLSEVTLSEGSSQSERSRVSKHDESPWRRSVMLQNYSYHSIYMLIPW